MDNSTNNILVHIFAKKKKRKPTELYTATSQIYLDCRQLSLAAIATGGSLYGMDF
jgi:hypothetical protein